MKRIDWPGGLAGVLGVALLAAVGASALPDNPYQRWQLIEKTLYANATWSFERIRFDPAPIDVAILGSSRAQLGLSAPRMTARLAAAGLPLTVANLAVIEDGRNLEWAIADELFRAKRPRALIVLINETMSLWGHPGFKYVAPAAAVALPPRPLLHNSLGDLVYLPYRQLRLFAARLVPGVIGLRTRFDPVRFAAKPADDTVSRTLADGKRIDMDATVDAATLRAEATAFAATRHRSRLPRAVAAVTDLDNRVYVDQIVALAARHGTPVIFVFLPEFGGATAIEGRDFYARRGNVADFGDLARDPALYQSFAHLNRRGALIASDRLAAVVTEVVGTGRQIPDRAAPGGTT